MAPGLEVVRRKRNCRQPQIIEHMVPARIQGILMCFTGTWLHREIPDDRFHWGLLGVHLTPSDVAVVKVSHPGGQ